MSQAVIPQEDLKNINRILRARKSQTIRKNAFGEVIGVGVETNDKYFGVNIFHGKKVKHRKSVFTSGKQIIVAEAGDEYDQIPLDKRQLVDWFESDFQ